MWQGGELQCAAASAPPGGKSYPAIGDTVPTLPEPRRRLEVTPDRLPPPRLTGLQADEDFDATQTFAKIADHRETREAKVASHKACSTASTARAHSSTPTDCLFRRSSGTINSRSFAARSATATGSEADGGSRSARRATTAATEIKHHADTSNRSGCPMAAALTASPGISTRTPSCGSHRLSCGSVEIAIVPASRPGPSAPVPLPLSANTFASPTATAASATARPTGEQSKIDPEGEKTTKQHVGRQKRPISAHGGRQRRVRARTHTARRAGPVAMGMPAGQVDLRIVPSSSVNSDYIKRVRALFDSWAAPHRYAIQKPRIPRRDLPSFSSPGRLVAWPPATHVEQEEAYAPGAHGTS